MRTIRRILVAIKDPQSKSHPAVMKAAQLARAFGAELELFHGLDAPLYADTVFTADEGFRGVAHEMRARSLNRLELIADRIRVHSVKVTTAVEWDFPIFESIVRRAVRTGADLIVTGCRSGRRVAPMLLRLTDWELLRLSPIPVLVVKNPHPYRHPNIVAAIDPAHVHAKPSKLDNEILKAGAAMQSALRGKLHAVHGYAPVLAVGTPFGSIVTAGLMDRMVSDLEKNAQAGFDRVLRKTAIPKKRRHLISRPPREAIEGVVRETRGAMVVMGAVSRSGLKRIFIGNTAESLLDDLSCDVLIVKPAHFANRVPRARRGILLIAANPAPSY